MIAVMTNQNVKILLLLRTHSCRKDVPLAECAYSENHS